MTSAPPKSPGEIVADLLKDNHLNQTEAAAKLSITRPYLNSIINGKYPLTAEMRIKLSGLLGTKPDFWSDVQKSYDTWQVSDSGRVARRALMADSLNLNLDISGGHVLVDHEIESAVNAGVLGIAGFDRERLQASCYHFAIGLRGFTYPGGGVETREAATKPGLVLKRGQMVTLSTRESLTLPSRIRAVVMGLTEQWCGKFLHCDVQRLYEPGMSGPLTFGLLNQGPYELTLHEGEPCLAVSFEYLAHEPVAVA
jgi:addiction module HigA family antidote